MPPAALHPHHRRPMAWTVHDHSRSLLPIVDLPIMDLLMVDLLFVYLLLV